MRCCRHAAAVSPGLAARVALVVALVAAHGGGNAREGEPRVARFAIVMGNNVGPPDLAPLRYADDDAARLHEILVAAGVSSTLLAVLDADSQRVSPQSAAQSQPPTLARLDQALVATFAQVREAQAGGAETELYFAFAGHGRGGAGQGGVIYLLDGVFTRQDLMERVIAPSPADYNHVIIDACDSYFMVAARGGGAYPEDHIPLSQADELVRSFLAGDGILQEPRTGFLVSTNQAAESHEYDGFRAGVFSHVVRSALVGAADADGDGRLEYSEVLAYVAAASQRIEDPGARLNVFGRAPPRNVHRPVLDLGRSAFKHWLRLGPELSGRIHVNDARNIRYADLHKPAGTSALVALVEQPSYRVVTSSGEAQVRLRGMGSGALRAHPVEVPGRRARGPEESLRGELFSIPYDGSFYRGFVVSRGMAPARTEQPFLPPDAVRPWRVPARPPFLLGAPGVVALAGGGLLGAGAVLTTLAHLVSYDTLLRTLQTEGVVDEQVTQQLVVLKTATVLFLAAGLSLVALGGVLVALEVLLPRGGGEP